MILTTDDAADRLATVHSAIARAARSVGRDPAHIELVAISKTWAPDAIAPLIAAGHRSFGENRVAEAQDKWPALRAEVLKSNGASARGLRLHLVGQLQSNKAADAVALFDVIHSVDRPSLIAALGQAMNAAGKHPDCYIQVNIGGEVQKGGCAIADLPDMLAAARAAGVPVIGLMCVPPADTEAAPFFALLAELARRHGLSQLSMGMSADYESAAMLGATVIRVGSALFGNR